VGSKLGDVSGPSQIVSPKGLVRRIHCYSRLWYRDSCLFSHQQSNGPFSSPPIL
ncbi:unnamed protein product, partial [Musa textilis]